MRAWAAVAARSARAVAATGIGVGMAVTVQPPADAAQRRPDPAAGVEAAHCRGRGRGDPGGDQPGAGLAQHVTVSVPRTAVVTVDHAGRVVAAATNTGCRPGAGDDVFVRRPDGSIVPAPPGAFAGVAWTGDFTRGLAGSYGLP